MFTGHYLEIPFWNFKLLFVLEARFDFAVYFMYNNDVNYAHYYGGYHMPNIRPVSDLRNYKSVLDEVSYGSPVYLTKNGRGDYAIVNMKELDELNAMKALIWELGKGEASAKDGWISLEDVEKRLGL